MSGLTEIKPKPPECVHCHKVNAVRPYGNRDWYCLDCKIIFDPEDDGDVGYGPSDRRMNREERRKARGRPSHGTPMEWRVARAGEKKI